MQNREQSLTALAIQMGLSLHETVALPSVISKAAGLMKMQEPQMIAHAASCLELREYLKGACIAGAGVLLGEVA